MNAIKCKYKQLTDALSPRINASEFEEKLLNVEDLIQNHCTSENWSKCEKSLSSLNKLLNRHVRPEDRVSFIKRMVNLQTKLAAYQTSFAESSSNKNFTRNVATRKTPQNSRSNSRQQDYQRSSTNPTEYYNKSASHSSTVIDLENAGGPKNNAISKNIEEYNQKINAANKLTVNKLQKLNTQSKHELNGNAENKTYNLRSSNFSSSVRTDNQLQRFQNCPTEQEMRQIMDNTSQSFSTRTDENQANSASKKHQNCKKSTTENPTSRMENNREQLEQTRYGFCEDRKDEYQTKAEEQQQCNSYEGNNQSQTFTGDIFEQQRNRNQVVRAGEKPVHTILPSHHYNWPYIHGLPQNTNQMIDKVSHEYPVRVAQQSGDYQGEALQQQQEQQYNNNWGGYSFTGPGVTTGYTYNEFELLLDDDKIKATTVGKAAEYNKVKQNCYNSADENMGREAQQFDHEMRRRKEEEIQHLRGKQEYLMGHGQTGSYGHYEFEQQSSWNKPTATKYEINYKGNVALPRTKTGYKDFEYNQSIDNWSLNDPRRVAQTSGPYQNEYQTYLPETEALQRSKQRQYQQQKQQFGHYDEDHQRQREEEEEEALQQAQQREVEENRQRQEREKLQQYQRQPEEQRIKGKERQQQRQYQQQTQQFGHYDQDHQRQREEEEEEEEALQQAQQREVEEKRQRQEREKLQQHQRQLEEQRIKGKERQQQQQYQQQKQQFGHYDEEYQRQLEEEEEEEAQQLHQRKLEERRQRQEREKLQQHQRQLEEQRIKEKERQLQQQAEEINKTEIVDISDQFIDDSIKNHPNKNNLEYFQLIINKAKSFKHNIEQFKGDDYMEYFILHENLMQLIEIMDRIRCENDEILFPYKIKIIEYIKRLIEDLDARNQS